MKPNVKIVLVLGAGLVAVGLVLWLRSRTGPAAELAPAAAAPSASQSEVAPPVAPLAPATRSQITAAPGPIPESVRAIVTASATSSFPERVKDVRALPADLTPGEVQAFHAYLLAPSPSGAKYRQAENWLRNVIMDKLAEAPTLPAGLAGVLMAIYQDPAQDVVMRDYAVQHITPIYARVSADEKATLQQTLWQAAAETDSSIAGTALLALRDLAQAHREFDQDRLGEEALRLAGDDRCGELSRITALQVCGRMGIHQAAPLALELTQNTGSVSLQLAAIAVLGDVGDAAAQNHLRQLAVHSEPRLRPALETALKKLTARPGG